MKSQPSIFKPTEEISHERLEHDIEFVGHQVSVAGEEMEDGILMLSSRLEEIQDKQAETSKQVQELYTDLMESRKKDFINTVVDMFFFTAMALFGCIIANLLMYGY